MSTDAGVERCDTLIAHAGELLIGQGDTARRGRALSQLNVLHDGAIAVTNGTITAIGTSGDLLARFTPDRYIDAAGNLVSPGFVDPHTHLIHAGTRHLEWERMVTGRGYAGLDHGIMSTVRRTRAETPAALRVRALADLDEMLAHGTTTVEVKSGYGLDRHTELRLLDIAHDLEHPIDVIATYLGAHVLPAEYADDREAYLRLVADSLDEASTRAEFCDVCCDPVGFTADECRRIIGAARQLGMEIKIHGDQTGNAGGAALAAEVGAISVDHIDAVDEAGIKALAASETVGVILPGVTHHMLENTPALTVDGQRSMVHGSIVHADRPDWAHRLIDSGVALALSTDYNPGSCCCLSMQAIMQIAARMYRLDAASIWNMATINAAAAVGRAHVVGSLDVGKQADIVVWRVPSHGLVINRFGANLAAVVVKKGVPVWSHRDSGPTRGSTNTERADAIYR